MGFELKGLYVITDEGLIQRDSFLETVEKSLAGGANIVQLRDKTSPRSDVFVLGMGVAAERASGGVVAADEVERLGRHPGGEDLIGQAVHGEVVVPDPF